MNNDSPSATLREFAPLIVFSVLAPATVGAAATLIAMRAGPGAEFGLSFLTGLALVVSLSHLGQPYYFYRALRNPLRSWLSREALFYGAFAGLFALQALARLAGLGPAGIGILAWGVLSAGVLSVVATARVYAVPSRPDWGHWSAQAAFGLTALTAGPALALQLLRLFDRGAAILLSPAAVLAWVVALLGGAALAWQRRQYLRRSLGAGLPRWYEAVLLVRVVVGCFAPLLLLRAGGTGGYPWGAIVLAVFAGELIERGLFFVTGRTVAVATAIAGVRREYERVPVLEE